MISAKESCLIPDNVGNPLPESRVGSARKASETAAVRTRQSREKTEDCQTEVEKRGGSAHCFPPPISSAQLESAGTVHTQWLWRGYLAPESVTLLTSLWKSGKSTLIAVGLYYQGPDHVLQEGDEVSLFPPVQGG